MNVRAGPYVFTKIHYNARGDLMDLSIDGERWGIGDQDTPENHTWFVADNDSAPDDVVALQLNLPREILEREGAVHVTLPGGDRVELEGIEEVLKQHA
jgi:hypothetical protein